MFTIYDLSYFWRFLSSCQRTKKTHFRRTSEFNRLEIRLPKMFTMLLLLALSDVVSGYVTALKLDNMIMFWKYCGKEQSYFTAGKIRAFFILVSQCYIVCYSLKGDDTCSTCVRSVVLQTVFQPPRTCHIFFQIKRNKFSTFFFWLCNIVDAASCIVKMPW